MLLVIMKDLKKLLNNKKIVTSIAGSLIVVITAFVVILAFGNSEEESLETPFQSDSSLVVDTLISKVDSSLFINGYETPMDNESMQNSDYILGKIFAEKRLFEKSNFILKRQECLFQIKLEIQ